MKILVTGAAGFIGSALCIRLLQRGDDVIGVDNLNDYYDVQLKQARLNRLFDYTKFTFKKLDIVNQVEVQQLFQEQGVSKVMHLAAQAGVRYSITHPDTYINSNIVGFMNILEGCRHHKVEHFAYASSSSIYGANTRMPFSIHDNVDHPVSLYAATKKANELMAHTYSHLYQLPTTGLRFFTVYGPWGRPDMSAFMFTKNIIEGKPIDVFNYGNHRRDFTYIDDIIEGVIRVVDKPALANQEWSGDQPDPGTSKAPYRIYNIGNNTPVSLLTFIETLERCIGKEAIKHFLPMQPGDIPDTYADVTDLQKEFNYKPATQLREGLGHFVEWYKDFYKPLV
ncbi:MAG: NAD-dependent epimerase [Methylococcaceae bacterium]|nr:MAG: NAD-dependent epimerase [Methylococcaceae bacterium]